MLYMPTQWDKPFKSIPEQIEIIENRNVIIGDRTIITEALASISYYTLMNGYKNTFLSKDGTDNFKDGTSFSMIYSLHWLDISISNILFKYILLVEKSLKTKLSYYVGKNIGIDKISYLDDFRNYSNPNQRREGILNDIKDVVKNCNADSVTAYYRDHKNHVPPWIIVNDITFGLTQLWYSILKQKGKNNITQSFLGGYTNLSYDERQELFSKCIEILRTFRNKVAHGSRTFELNLSAEMPKVVILKLLSTDNIVTEIDYDMGLCKSDIFSVLISLCLLINDKIILENMLQDLKNFLYPYVSNNTKFIDKTVFDLFKIPNDTLERLDTLITNKPL